MLQLGLERTLAKIKAEDLPSGSPEDETSDKTPLQAVLSGPPEDQQLHKTSGDSADESTVEKNANAESSATSRANTIKPRHQHKLNRLAVVTKSALEAMMFSFPVGCHSVLCTIDLVLHVFELMSRSDLLACSVSARHGGKWLLGCFERDTKCRWNEF